MQSLRELSPDAIAEAEPELISQLLDDYQHIKKTGKALEARAKVLINQGVEIPNWGLKAGANTRDITDVQEAIRLILNAKELDVKPSDLLEICKIPVPKIAELIALKTGCSKDNADMTLAGILGDVLQSKQKAGSLDRRG